MSPQIYEHRQVGWLTVGPVFVVLGLVAWQLFSAGLTAPAIACLIFVAALLSLFGSLAVSVDHTALRLAFGVGLIRKTVLIRTIRAARAVRTHWYYGWGIRLTPRGWLWNISGFDAVELDLEGNSRFTIGTDDPEGLLRAINRART